MKQENTTLCKYSVSKQFPNKTKMHVPSRYSTLQMKQKWTHKIKHIKTVPHSINYAALMIENLRSLTKVLNVSHFWLQHFSQPNFESYFIEASFFLDAITRNKEIQNASHSNILRCYWTKTKTWNAWNLKPRRKWKNKYLYPCFHIHSKDSFLFIFYWIQ